MSQDEWFLDKNMPQNLDWKKKEAIFNKSYRFPYKLWMKDIYNQHPIYYVVFDDKDEYNYKKHVSNNFSYAVEEYDG